MEISNNMDWQIGIKQINQRARKILETGQWSDCTFIVGSESRHQTLHAHRLILAMASPVFEAMFYGSMAEKNDKPIEILDVQPQAFKAFLKYIYTDEMNFTSFDQVCEICYAAKKYMIPPLVKECTNYIWKDLHPGNVCRAYAFVRLFEEPQLLENCMGIMKLRTKEVLNDNSFEEADVTTIKSLLSQDSLNCSEVELWEAVLRWSKSECSRQSLDAINTTNQRKVLEEILPLIRFLTMNPSQFANGPAQSGILSQEECLSLLLNISSSGTSNLPSNFSNSLSPRKPPVESQRPPFERAYEYYGPQSSAERTQSLPPERNLPLESIQCGCAGPASGVFVNEQLVDCSLSFSVDTKVKILGVILPTKINTGYANTQIISNSSVNRGCIDSMYVPKSPYLATTYPELIYAFMQDTTKSRLTYTHFSTRVAWDSEMEILFNRPVDVNPNTSYKIVVGLNKMGRYPLYFTLGSVRVGDVMFSFEEDSSNVNVIKGLVFARNVDNDSQNPRQLFRSSVMDVYDA